MKFVEYAKMPKKQQKEVNRAKRRDWHGVDPRMKVVESKKVYKRVRTDWLMEY